MTKPNPEYGHLTAGQVRDIFRNKKGKTIRQLAIFYGVSESTIQAARREQQQRRFPGRRGRVALVNV